MWQFSLLRYLAFTVSAPALGRSSVRRSYLMLGSFQVDLLPRELPHTTIISCLHDGAVFRGSQKSKGKEYEVEVTIQVRYHHHLLTFSTPGCPLASKMVMWISEDGQPYQVKRQLDYLL
ncbi:hypothetical protein CLF_101083 [Clonorchis sinensis]|uniref:Uncharacterized protein n=1 Tax=Clonorchis sinensis TaxID=79923 RepID=G7Y4Z0_CLOSI|nr:hypothetical protein CLF_101083 [Clonorchis sinensis]